MIAHLYQWMTQSPDTPFIDTPRRTFTNSDIFYAAQSRARALITSGLTANDKIAMYSQDPMDAVEIFFACQLLNAVCIPLPFAMPVRELLTRLNMVNADCVFSQWQDMKLFKDTGIHTYPFNDRQAGTGSCGTGDDVHESYPEEVCTVLFTSGSAGAPKPVELTAGNFMASYSGWNSLIRFSRSDHHLCCLPLHHVGGLSIVVRAVLGRFSVTLMEKYDAKRVGKYLASGEITLVSLVPAMLHDLLNIGDRNVFHKNLRAIVMGGSALPSALADQCMKQNLPIVKSYGMTETCSGVTGFFLNAAPEKRHSSGKPFSGVNIRIEHGRIIVQGRQVMKGYSGDPERTTEFHTSDSGYVDEDGFVFVEGRIDDVIISGGENISLSGIESVLNRHPWVSESCAFGVPDIRWGQTLIVAVVMNATAPKDFSGWQSDPQLSEILTEFCRENLPAYKIPKNFIRVESIPKTDLGKVDREKTATLIRMNPSTDTG